MPSPYHREGYRKETPSRGKDPTFTTKRSVSSYPDYGDPELYKPSLTLAICSNLTAFAMLLTGVRYVTAKGRTYIIRLEASRTTTVNNLVFRTDKNGILVNPPQAREGETVEVKRLDENSLFPEEEPQEGNPVAGSKDLGASSSRFDPSSAGTSMTEDVPSNVSFITAHDQGLTTAMGCFDGDVVRIE